MQTHSLSTGLPSLDNMLQGLMPGDNVVWQVDKIDDYLLLVEPYWKEAVKARKQIVYFRFARHRELIPENQGVEIVIKMAGEARLERATTWLTARCSTN